MSLSCYDGDGRLENVCSVNTDDTTAPTDLCTSSLPADACVNMSSNLAAREETITDRRGHPTHIEY